MSLKIDKHWGFPMGNRMIATLLTIAGINLCAAQQVKPFENTDLPGWGQVTAVAKASGPNGVRLIGTWNGRIYRSTDGGASWRNGMGGGGAPVRAFFELADGTLLAGAGIIIDGVWDCFAFSCGNPYAGGGIFRSPDKGLTWTRVREEGATAFAVRAGRVYGATPGGIVFSSDQGKTWSAVPYEPAGTNMGTNARSLVWLGDRLLTISRYDPTYSATLRGDTLHFESPPFFDRYQRVFYAAPWLYVSSRVTGAGAGMDTLKRSNDGGKTWTLLANRYFPILAKGPLGLYGITDEGFFSSADGRVWNPLAPRLGGTSNTIEAFLPEKDSLYLGGSFPNGLGVYPIAAGSWTMPNQGFHDQATVDVEFVDGRLFAADGVNGMLFRDPGAASEWNRISALTAGTQLVSWKGRLFAIGNYGVSENTPADPTFWRPIAGVGGGPMVPSRDWLAVFNFDRLKMFVCKETVPAVCDSAAMTGFPGPKINYFTGGRRYDKFSGMAVSGDTVLIALDSMRISTDRGGHWTDLGPEPGGVSFLTAEAGVFWLGGADGLFRLNAAKRIWEPVAFEGGRGKPKAMVFRPGGDALVATDDGVYLKGRWESKWTDLSAGLEDRDVQSMAVEGNRLAVGLANGGVWMRDLEPVSGLLARAGGPSTAYRYRVGYGIFRDAKDVWRRVDGKSLKRF